jgi:PAS domain S-box-containing protein
MSMTVPPRDRVLLVDDEPQMLLALEDLLAERFDVTKTTSPDAALHVLEQERDIAVVVTDQRMPKMSGDELLAKLGPSCRAIRILVTGFADLNAVIRAVNEGNIFAYVTKPWDESDLFAKLERAVARFHSARALMNEQQVLHDLLLHSPDAIYLKDRELRFVQVNRTFAARHGAPTEGRLLGKRLSEIVDDPRLATQIEGEEQQLLEHGQPMLDVLREYLEGDTPRWFSETRAPIRGKGGTIVGLLGVSRDVTERMRVQQTLAASEARLRAQTQLLHAILDNLGEGVLVANSSGDFLLFNRRAEQLLGRSPTGMSARTWAQTSGVSALDRGAPLQPEDDPLLRAIAGEAWSETEFVVTDAGGALAHLVMIATPLLDAEGKPAGGIALLRDVTAHRALERRLAQAHKLEAVGRLAGGVAHDFNNLLTVIQGCAGLLLHSISESAQREDLQQISKAAERAANLTKQLMLFSRQQVATFEVLDVNSVVAELSSMLERVLGEDVKFTTRLGGDVRAIKGDRSQIEQVVMNLTVNARDAMPNGGDLTVSTRNVRLAAFDLKAIPGAVAGDFVVITVRDTGVGMDAATQARMFEPFYTTKGVGKGTGLGLATVYGIVRQSGGFVNCDSRVGHGTTFELYLPATDERAKSSASERGPDARAPRVEGTILLVEDEDAVRNMALRMLRMGGYRVLAATRPSEAKRLYEQHRAEIDVIVTDIVMPEMSGTQLIAELGVEAALLPVVYVTGYAGASAPIVAGARPNTWLLEKPFTAKALLAKIGEAVRK